VNCRVGFSAQPGWLSLAKLLTMIRLPNDCWLNVTFETTEP
jgi:hypothetical protein